MGTIKKTEKLEHLSVAEIKGDDSAEFLQGQMTQDIYSIEDSKASVTSILNPQGRIVSTAFVFKWGESFILILNNEVRDKLITWLSRFILRSKVEITKSEDFIFGLNQEYAKKLCSSLNVEAKDIGFESDESASVTEEEVTSLNENAAIARNVGSCIFRQLIIFSNDLSNYKPQCHHTHVEH